MGPFSSCRLTGGPLQTAAAPRRLGGALSVLADRPLRLAVTAGQRVAAGDLLFSDKKAPWITQVAPLSGRITRLETGERRGISQLELAPEADLPPRTFDVSGIDGAAALRDLMIAAGLWQALRSRPFGRVADPAAQPARLFVTLTEGRPGAPDPEAALLGSEDCFLAGLRALVLLCPGRVVLCHPPRMTFPAVAGVASRAFRGGLASDHIRAVHPVDHGGLVWQMPWQEVVALGHLLRFGRIRAERVVALSGPAVRKPVLLRACQGLSLQELVEGRLKPGAHRLTAIDAAGQPGLWLQGIDLVSAQVEPRRAGAGRPHWSRLLRPRLAALTPNAWDDRLAPSGVLIWPLLRALAAGDAERARDLGALGLIEADLGALSARLGDRLDYPALLRRTLDELEAAA